IPVGLFATADDAYGGAFITDGANYPAVYVVNRGAGGAINAGAAAGNGIETTSNGSGSGLVGTAFDLTQQHAGVEGVANATSTLGRTYTIYGGVWGDTGTSSTTVSPAWAIGVLGTADDSHAGVFLNNSDDWSTLYAYNYGGGATGLFKTFMAVDKDGTCGIGGGGSLSCTGQIKSLVAAGDGART